jgi:hypothetical protein
MRAAPDVGQPHPGAMCHRRPLPPPPLKALPPAADRWASPASHSNAQDRLLTYRSGLTQVFRIAESEGLHVIR